MRIIVAGIGSFGDTIPYLALASALNKRGHEVIFLAAEPARERVEKEGITFYPVLSTEQYDRWRTLPPTLDVDLTNQRVLMRLVMPAMVPTYEVIAEQIGDGNTLCMGNIAAVGVKIAHEKLGVPIIELNIAPICWRTERIKSGSAKNFDRTLGSVVNNFRVKIGLSPQTSGILTALSTFERCIGLYPPWFAEAPSLPHPRHIIATDYLFSEADDSAPLAESVQAFLAVGDRPIAFTFGSFVTNRADIFASAMRACQQLGKRAIFLTQYAEQLPNPLPESILHVKYVSFMHLFPHLEMVVHHAGAGTAGQVFKAGIPQLVYPMAYDQFENANRIEALGVGQQLSSKEMLSNALADKLAAIMTSSGYYKKAKALSHHFQSLNPVNPICELVEHMATQGATK